MTVQTQARRTPMSREEYDRLSDYIHGEEEYRWTPEGYLRAGAVGGGQTFRPKLFPELEINLAALIGEAT